MSEKTIYKPPAHFFVPGAPHRVLTEDEVEALPEETRDLVKAYYKRTVAKTKPKSIKPVTGGKT